MFTIFIYIFVGLLLIYIIALLTTSKYSVLSGRTADTSVKHGDQIYYLPIATIQAKCTAKINITREESGTKIIDLQLTERSFEFTTQIIPDTNNLISLQYRPSIFANDELTLQVNAIGLLEGVNILTEDRISEIVTQISNAPQFILGKSQNSSSALATTTVVTETREFSRTFLIYAEEIAQKAVARTWEIHVDGMADQDIAQKVVDASFNLQFDGIPLEIPVETTYKGIITRPLTTIGIAVNPDRTIAQSGNITPQYYLQIPDTSRLIYVPITRSSGVKKSYGLRFSNGNLIETIIKKPSEVESLVSIPIKIAKAFVSIPAELFNFKIENIKRQTSHETEKQNLDKALLISQKNEIGLEAELLKAKVEAQKTMLSFESDVAKSKIEAEKNLIDSQKSLIIAKKDWENAKKELQDLLEKLKNT